MANPQIIYSDITTYTFSATEAAATGFPLTNLNDYEPLTKWKSANNNIQSLTIDFGSAKTCDTLVLDNHNFYSAYMPDSALYLSSSNSSTFASGVTADHIVLSNNNTIAIPITSRSARYWRLNFITMPLSTAPYAGQIFLTTALKFDTTYRWGYKKENAEYVTSQKVTLDGSIRTSQIYAGRLKYELEFELQTDTLKNNFQTFHRAVRGSLIPFYWIDIDGTTRYMHCEDYVPVSVRRYGQNDIQSLLLKTHGASF